MEPDFRSNRNEILSLSLSHLCYFAEQYFCSLSQPTDFLHGTENMAEFYTLYLQLMERNRLLSLHPSLKTSGKRPAGPSWVRHTPPAPPPINW